VQPNKLKKKKEKEWGDNNDIIGALRRNGFFDIANTNIYDVFLSLNGFKSSPIRHHKS
jgi:hypothetical protein